MNLEYGEWFKTVTSFKPHGWQRALGEDGEFKDRLLRIPTGFGKTAGVVLAWLYHRVVKGDPHWPLRLAYALPMRVLVEQSADAINEWLSNPALDSGTKVDLHVLMGGVEGGRYAFAPERPSILLGTQDMLLSRALNRGYGPGRGHWPIDFGLLHHDTLWLMDEVQLMGVGLATSAQLNAYRRQDSRLLRPTATWWMSATLQPRWLKSPETEKTLPSLEADTVTIPVEARSNGLWEIRKPLDRRADVSKESEIAALVQERHEAGTLTLVVLNRVDRALAVHEALTKAYSQGTGSKRKLRADAPELCLVHSRYRGHERAKWAKEFLRKDAPLPETGRIVVATQVVEAGVDISARLLVTDLAPWPSLVQRYGRCARRQGENGHLVVVGEAPDDTKGALPYLKPELTAAHAGLDRLIAEQGRGDIGALEAFEESLGRDGTDLLSDLYPYDPLHLLLLRDLLELFDTTPDLSGADLDVGRYIREGDERDVSVFWRPLEGMPLQLEKADVGRVAREELCPVPFLAARKWLKGKPAYVFDYLEGKWLRVIDQRRIFPGMRLLVDAGTGGYDPLRGWDPRARPPVAAVMPTSPENPEAERFEQTASDAEDDSLSVSGWKTIATHGREAAEIVAEFADALEIPAYLKRLLTLAARHHDSGKAAKTFQAAIKEGTRAEAGEAGERRDLAKAPKHAWRRPAYPDRPGFRHELVSVLALFELLRRANPMHEALLGSVDELLELLGEKPQAPAPLEEDNPLAAELMSLSASELDLVAYLVVSHHGKVRTSWSATPKDLEHGQGGIHGVHAEDVFPETPLAGADGELHSMPELTLHLDLAGLGASARYGRSWTERVAALLERHGPFVLAYLEALLRIADHRSSALSTEDPALDL